MVTTLAALVASAVAAPLAGQESARTLPHLDDHGTFEISSAGKRIGFETFTIHASDGQIEAEGNVHLQVEQNGKSLEVTTTSRLALGSRLEPLAYTWSQKGAQSSELSIDFHSHPAHVRYKTVNGHEDRRDFGLEKDVVVLDDNSLHQYQLAVARYDAAKGGTQTFRAFVPQEATPGVITLNLLGPEPITVGGEKRTLCRFELTTELAQITLWADEQGHLQMISVPAVQYQAVRRK